MELQEQWIKYNIISWLFLENAEILNVVIYGTLWGWYYSQNNIQNEKALVESAKKLGIDLSLNSL